MKGGWNQAIGGFHRYVDVLRRIARAREGLASAAGVESATKGRATTARPGVNAQSGTATLKDSTPGAAQGGKPATVPTATAAKASTPVKCATANSSKAGKGGLGTTGVGSTAKTAPPGGRAQKNVRVNCRRPRKNREAGGIKAAKGFAWWVMIQKSGKSELRPLSVGLDTAANARAPAKGGAGKAPETAKGVGLMAVMAGGGKAVKASPARGAAANKQERSGQFAKSRNRKSHHERKRAQRDRRWEKQPDWKGEQRARQSRQPHRACKGAERHTHTQRKHVEACDRRARSQCKAARVRHRKPRPQVLLAARRVDAKLAAPKNAAARPSVKGAAGTGAGRSAKNGPATAKATAPVAGKNGAPANTRTSNRASPALGNSKPAQAGATTGKAGTPSKAGTPNSPKPATAAGRSSAKGASIGTSAPDPKVDKNGPVTARRAREPLAGHLPIRKEAQARLPLLPSNCKREAR
ncbi:hypothetical protein DFJ73DRAFT_756490 [Zopfochytrium polystomum]|nr:hypothetical protein DFJ73DRAFT_756490 [Zopfochytrium polystomum]